MRSRLDRRVWLVAGAITALLLAVSGRYGFHRDELYFLVAGRRLDWGFVDQPPLTPVLARLSELMLGTNPTAIRVLPAIAIGTVAVLTAVMARRFGAGGRAQVGAAMAGGGSGIALAFGHLLATATFDYLLWTVATVLFVVVLDEASPKRWLALGTVVGLGLLNKHLIGALVLALVVGLVATRRRTLLRSPWPWVGGLVAIALATPNLVWQARNGWPQLEMAEALAARSDGPVAFVVQQVGLLSIVLAVPAAIGWWRLLRNQRFECWRPIGIAVVVLFGLFWVLGGKAYYVAPLYPALLAAGSTWYEELPIGRRRLFDAFAAVGLAAGTLIALPLLPPSMVGGFDPTGELGETIGWPELVAEVEAAIESVPHAQHRDIAIFTSSYGQAGAIDVLGGPRGLPAAVSGHNNYWLWGPPDGHGPIIALGPVVEWLRPICDDFVVVGTIENPWGVGNEEFGNPVSLCLEPTGRLSDIWETLRHYN